jgi:hypothetical protein
MSTNPAPVQRLVGRISKADANRRHHLKGCAGYEDCQCFGRYWTHAEIYSMKEIMREACCLLRECLPHSTGGPPGYLNNRISVWLERADPPNPRVDRAAQPLRSNELLDGIPSTGETK